ncbi:MAG: hypothetical protein HY785_17965 [Oscillatoriophycideae cyanobacterium NC_groundwater_1537_Pr4_S-0.65um_50_18]|nr:hypothetical protein [Oscillatoriophycideae cyanobacterium NC_groundwater_1537_Pr4_S-0.65um_50_18]
MLRANLKYLTGFGAGLAVAASIPVVATPISQLSISKEVLTAQAGGASVNSLNKLATCLETSGYIADRRISQGGSAEAVPNYEEGFVANVNDYCANLRNEGEIQTPIRCMRNGETVQVLLKNRKPITLRWNNLDHVFVIAYSDGSKGWVVADSIKY